MNDKAKKLCSILVRYFILLIIIVPGFGLFYNIFTNLTIYPSYFLLNIFYEAEIIGNIILLSRTFPIEIIGACVAGGAYAFLLILNISTPNIKFPKRIFAIFSSFLIFLIINIIRIFLLSILYYNGSSLFEFLHKLFWYLGSTFFVVLIWFAEVKIFKIKKIPIYSDLKFLYNESTLGKNTKESKSSKKN